MSSPALPQLSIQIPNFAESTESWDHTFAVARLADRVGVDRVVVSEHILYGEHLEAYADPRTGGSAGGRQPTGPDGHWLDPLTVLAMVGAQTERVRLGTAVLLIALRSPALVAKQAATLDVLTGGRLDLGVGVGWQREEYEAVGLSFEGRGALLDRALALCQRLWTEQVVDHDDGELLFRRVHQMPKPLQPGGVPLWISGRLQPRTVARVVRFGTGWIPWGDDVADPRPGIAALRAALAEAGRDPGALQVQGVLPVVRAGDGIDLDATMAAVPELVEAGVTDFRFQRRWGADLAAETELLEAVVPAFRRTVGREPA